MGKTQQTQQAVIVRTIEIIECSDAAVASIEAVKWTR